MWFRPTEPGRYLFVYSQYCGTNHALMGGWGTVMEPSDYAAWLSGSSGGSANPVVTGEKLFAERACITCHVPDGTGRAPSLNGLYGGQVAFAARANRPPDRTSYPRTIFHTHPEKSVR